MRRRGGHEMEGCDDAIEQEERVARRSISGGRGGAQTGEEGSENLEHLLRRQADEKRMAGADVSNGNKKIAAVS